MSVVDVAVILFGLGLLVFLGWWFFGPKAAALARLVGGAAYLYSVANTLLGGLLSALSVPAAVYYEEVL